MKLLFVIVALLAVIAGSATYFLQKEQAQVTERRKSAERIKHYQKTEGYGLGPVSDSLKRQMK